MRIAMVFHKDPFATPTGIDLVRLRAISGGLRRRGIDAEIVAPVLNEGVIDDFVPVRRLDALCRRGCYDLVKTCYHYSVELVREYEGPLVCRIVRVVDEKSPPRDEPNRRRLMACQEYIRQRAVALSLNNRQNEERWRRLYGEEPPVVIVPTGCPAEIPPPGPNPYPASEDAILFLGSLGAPRMVRLLNEVARRLVGRCTVHLVGLNKTRMYGGREWPLDPLVRDHGELPEDQIWDYIRNARVGLAIAAGSDPFDNDISKIVSYLRGGLPVLSEERIVTNDLVRETCYGKIFAFDDADDLVAGALELLNNPPHHNKSSAVDYVIREHSWDRRVEIYVEMFNRLTGSPV